MLRREEGMQTRTKYLAALFALLLVLAPSVGAQADKDHKEHKASAKDVEEYTERAQNAAAVLRDLMATPDKGIPEEVMEHARGVAVIPHVVKAAFGIGGRWGKGLMAAKTS